ncbi:DNA repair protein REV1 isoform X2 [Aristolochia californica]|uniref:DNA repair protein REV1 isoform X2 n=1 Tax=Aristolochia californica TaxID=171875 RepID=UPI0035DA5BB7
MSFDSSRSSNSKRSRDSRASNKSRDKKRIGQKPLGVAWGANSLSASKCSSGNSRYSDITRYMEVKNRKLREQFDADAEASTSQDALFSGISIFVDGYTVPSNQELRAYMLKYGGRFENYFSRHRVTHIICSNLPDSKLRNLRSFSAGLPVVNPTWILDSVAANRVMNWVPYQLDQIAKEAQNQQKLSHFFACKGKSKSEDFDGQEKCKTEVGDIAQAAFSDEKSPETRGEEPMVHIDNQHEEGDDFTHCGLLKPYEERVDKPGSPYSKEEHKHYEAVESSENRPSDAVSSCYLDNEKEKASTSLRSTRPENIRHSTLWDPNFVENYFKSSRLHFIGTWRNRYRKRFRHLLHGAKRSSGNVNADTASKRTTVIHIDMDCFFVAVIIRDHPELLDKPVAICHSDNPKGTAEISSANYPARDFGVRAGMFVRDAKALCPHLVIFPYNFEAYAEVADQFYDILHNYCNKVQAVSCDEAFIDVTELEVDPQEVALKIRQEIEETTRCTASAGISGNLLLARLATKKAKPNGQYYIPSDKVEEYLDNLQIKALPGIGHVLAEKLKKRHIHTCGELRSISKEALQKDFGAKTGDMLWNFSRGIDNRPVEVVQETKSIGAEVNWGVRFNDLNDAQEFLLNLCKEVSFRLQDCGMLGHTITLKVKKRKKDAEEPKKYMGCGDCENLSHSMTVPIAIDEVDVLQRISKQLFATFHVDVKEVRGVGLQISRLESADQDKQGNEKNSLKSWLASGSKIIAQAKEGSDKEVPLLVGSSSCTMKTDCGDQIPTLPAMSQLDLTVIESLPPEIISEINEMYRGKLTDVMERTKFKDDKYTSSGCMMLQQYMDGTNAAVHAKGKWPVCTPDDFDVGQNEDMARETVVQVHEGPSSPFGAKNLSVMTSVSNRVDFMPSSLSQVDDSVLQQLPQEVKADILETLPLHRVRENSSIDAKQLMHGESSSGQIVSESNLWGGNPPKWVGKFKLSNCMILNIFVESYHKCGCKSILSSILQCIISFLPFSLELGSEDWDEAISCVCEFVMSYVELKIESDIEEIYICFRLLKRFSMKSEFFLQVYSLVLPSLHALFSEKYGGILQLSDAE